jgi:hypothetical protein
MESLIKYTVILDLRDEYRKETGKSTISHPAYYIHWLEDKYANLILKLKEDENVQSKDGGSIQIIP